MLDILRLNRDAEPPACSAEQRPEGGWIWRDEAAGVVKSPFVLFLPDGGVGGSAAGALCGWRGGDGEIVLTDHAGREWEMAWEPRGFAGAGQTLRPAGEWPIQALPPVRWGRRNLVVLRAGDQSLHPLWLETMGGVERNWDLCLSYYGDHPELWRGQAEYLIPQKGSKFGGLAALIGSQEFLWEYEYIWFPDDDLLIAGADINRLFALARRFGLSLAQPSLAPGCFVNHRITEQQPRSLLRFTSFVEIMAPLFAREALAVVAPSFGFNQSGYGLDHLWPALLGSKSSRVAVLDAIAMVHTRPMGANYDVEGASSEGWAVLDRFGLCQRYATHGVMLGQSEGWERRHGEPSKRI